MSITSATLESAVESLATAIDGGNWSTARTLAVKIRAYLIALPDYGGSGRNVRWDRTAIDKLLAQVDQLSARRGAARVKAGLRYV